MYRQGTLSVCSPKFAEFKFCLSIKTLDPDERRAAWIRRRAEWWASRRVGRSSEDVWEMRRYVASFWIWGEALILNVWCWC